MTRIAKEGSTYTRKLIALYPQVTRTSYLSQAEIEHFPAGTFKGKWVSLTKDKLDQLLGAS